MVETQSNANAALSRAVHFSHEHFTQLQKHYETGTQTFKDRLMKDLESLSTRTQLYFEKMTTRLDAAFMTSLKQLRSTTDAMNSDIASLNNVRQLSRVCHHNVVDKFQNVQNAETVSRALEKNVGKAFQKVVEGSSELAKVQAVQWDASRGAATELQILLKNLQQGDVSALVESLAGMGTQLVSLGCCARPSNQLTPSSKSPIKLYL